MRYLKPVVFAVALMPFTGIAIDLLRGAMVEPVAESLNRCGFWALFFLTSSLACTPAKIVFGWTWPNRVRRMLGLFAFFYASLHLLTYAVVDQGLDLQAIVVDITKRKFITIGFLTYLLLLPLAITSTQGWVKRLGFKKWKRLHRLAYVAGITGVIHFVWRVKADVLVPGIFAAVILALFSVRLISKWHTKKHRLA